MSEAEYLGNIAPEPDIPGYVSFTFLKARDWLFWRFCGMYASAYHCC
jgi:hypothetical protein